MNCFDITSQTKTFKLTAGEVGSAELTITNTSGRPVTGIISVSDRNHPDATWLRFVNPQQQHFENNESNIIPISIHSQSNAIIGNSTIKFLIAAEHNPDEIFSTYDFALSISAPSEKSKPRWPWIVAAACWLLFVIYMSFWIFGGRGTAQVPSVVGLRYTEAAQRLRDAGFESNLAATDLSELQSPSFTDLAPELIRRIHFIENMNKDKKPSTLATLKKDTDLSESSDTEILKADAEIHINDPIITTSSSNSSSNDTRPNTSINSKELVNSLTNSDISTTLLEERLVWQQGKTGLLKKGTIISLKVVPQLLKISPPQSFGQEYLKTYFEKQHVFFKSAQVLPEGYRYGSGLEGAPTFNPSLEAVFEGSLVTATILPDLLEVPDFTKMNLNDITQLSQYRFQYIYYYAKGDRRSTAKLSAIMDWANVQKEQGQFVYIYHQIPEAGTRLPRDNHIITLEIDSRLSGLAQKPAP